MRLQHFAPLQAALWNHRRLSEPAVVVDDHGAALWTGRAIEQVPGDVDTPGTDLARRRSRVRRLAFRQSDGAPLARGARVLWRGRTETVDGTPDVADGVTVVTLA